MAQNLDLSAPVAYGLTYDTREYGHSPILDNWLGVVRMWTGIQPGWFIMLKTYRDAIQSLPYYILDTHNPITASSHASQLAWAAQDGWLAAEKHAKDTARDAQIAAQNAEFKRQNIGRLLANLTQLEGKLGNVTVASLRHRC